MIAGGFRVQTIAIEGFKGFTTRKEIALNGRHVFLLGQNGNGKSSIIEAVRWGLFGSAGRPNEVVANQHYPGVCRVQITLMREGKQWNLRRTLNRGTTGGSDAVLTDEYGNERSIREIMPQLDTVNAGEGMHIIFAPQSAPLRRQPEDLSAFERTVFNYLGLTHPRALLSHIDDFLEGQKKAEVDLGGELTDARTEIDKQITELTRSIRSIISSPPWDGGRSPSVAESENKARRLIEEITGSPPDQSLEGVSLEALIDSAEVALQARRAQDVDGLKKEAAAIAGRRERVENLQGIEMSIDAQRSTIDNVQSRLDTTLDGLTLDEVSKRVDTVRGEADTEVLTRRVIEDALALLNHNRTELISCPICESQHNRQDLELALQSTAHEQTSDAGSKLASLESQLRQCQELERGLQMTKDELTPLNMKAIEIEAFVDANDREYLDNTGDLDALIEILSEQESSIEEQVGDQEGWFITKNAQLVKLNDENRFHKIQSSLISLQRSRNRFAQVEAAYKDFVTFGESVVEIRRAVETRLNEQLAEEIPGVSEALSEAFAALTRHPWYDRLIISENALPKLELRVASTGDPSGSEHPTGVLNGQAESALVLVPYFAFSQIDDAPTEVYLVLLDDPTRAFDEEHIEILVERLAELGRRVQLIVASQETARFEALLPKMFGKDSYAMVEPTAWSYNNGPKLDIKYG